MCHCVKKKKKTWTGRRTERDDESFRTEPKGMFTMTAICSDSATGNISFWIRVVISDSKCCWHDKWAALWFSNWVNDIHLFLFISFKKIYLKLQWLERTYSMMRMFSISEIKFIFDGYTKVKYVRVIQLSGYFNKENFNLKWNSWIYPHNCVSKSISL